MGRNCCVRTRLRNDRCYLQWDKFDTNTQMRKSKTFCTPSIVDLQNFDPSLTKNMPFNYGKTRAERVPAKENPCILLGIFCFLGSSRLSSQPSCFKIYVRQWLYTQTWQNTHTHIHKAAVSHSAKLVQMLRMSSHSVFSLRGTLCLCLTLPLSRRTIDQISALLSVRHLIFGWGRWSRNDDWVSKPQQSLCATNSH